MKQSVSDKATESNKKSISATTSKAELQPMNSREKRQFSEYEELPFQQGLPLKEDDNKSKIPVHDREIFMAILSEPTNQKDNPTAQEDIDYDDFLSNAGESEIVAISCEIPPPPPGITVTVHLDNNPKMILKIEHHQQLGDSFDYSNSDLHNVINIGRNAKTVIIIKGEDQEEVEAYSLTSNYQLPDNYEYNSRK